MHFALGKLSELISQLISQTLAAYNQDTVFLNSILWILRTSAPWCDLPTHYGLWQMVSGRFYQ